MIKKHFDDMTKFCKKKTLKIYMFFSLLFIVHTILLYSAVGEEVTLLEDNFASLFRKKEATEFQQGHAEQYLLFWNAAGFSNQLISLTRAAQVAYATNRTLVLPPVLPHLSFQHKLKYTNFKYTSGPRCNKEKQIYHQMRIAREPNDFPSFKALFNFDSVTEKTNGLKVIDMPIFSRLEHINTRNFRNWCINIYKEEDGRCSYPPSDSILLEISNAIEMKCTRQQIAAIGSSFYKPPPNATEITNWMEIESYFDNLDLSTGMLKLLAAIYKKLPKNYIGSHIRLNDKATCKPRHSCEESCNEERTKSAFEDLITEMDNLHNASHVLLGYGWEIVPKCFEYFAKEKYSFTTVYETVENDPELLQMLERIGSEKDTVYLLLDQILIGIAENVVMGPKKSGSTYQKTITKWHDHRHEILQAMNEVTPQH